MAIAVLLTVPSWCRGQGSPPALKILIAEGEQAINNIRQRTAREPIVEVRDENNRPVAGAAVTFLLPGSGPSGQFANGLQTLTVNTDSAGRAVASGFRPNQTAGRFRIEVRAEYQNRTAQNVINQRNLARSPWLSWKTLAAAAAVVVVVVLVVRGVRGDNNNTTPGTDVSIGRPTVGPR